MPTDYRATHPEYVDNAPLREAFTSGSISACKLAEAVGIMRTAHTTRKLKSGEVKRYPTRKGDGTAVRRDLGLTLQHAGEGRGAGGYRRRIKVPKALRYAEALGVDPVALGL